LPENFYQGEYRLDVRIGRTHAWLGKIVVVP